MFRPLSSLFHSYHPPPVRLSAQTTSICCTYPRIDWKLGLALLVRGLYPQKNNVLDIMLIQEIYKGHYLGPYCTSTIFLHYV